MSGPGRPSATERLDRIEAALKRIEAKQDQVLEFWSWCDLICQKCGMPTGLCKCKPSDLAVLHKPG